jgi:transposase
VLLSISDNYLFHLVAVLLRGAILVERNRAADHWHCDETRWLVFEKPAAKANFIWMLWVFATKESIVFVLDPTRAHGVPEGHFGDDAEGIASVDRYSAYKAMAPWLRSKRAKSCWLFAGLMCAAIS